jgi:hypothetical protein
MLNIFSIILWKWFEELVQVAWYNFKWNPSNKQIGQKHHTEIIQIFFSIQQIRQQHIKMKVEKHNVRNMSYKLSLERRNLQHPQRTVEIRRGEDRNYQ